MVQYSQIQKKCNFGKLKHKNAISTTYLEVKAERYSLLVSHFALIFSIQKSRISLPQQMLKIKRNSERSIQIYFYFGAMCDDMVWHAHRSHTKQSLIDGKTFQNATRLMFFVQVANELYFSVKMRDHFLPHVCILQQQQLLALSVHPSVLLRLVISSCIILTKQPKKIETIDKPLITPVSFGTWIYHHYSGCYNPGSIVQCFFLVIVGSWL